MLPSLDPEPLQRQLTEMGRPIPATSNIAPSARSSALDLVGAVLRRKRPLDDAIDDHDTMSALAPRDRGFARLLVATVLRRLGQIDALLAHCLDTPLPPRAAPFLRCIASRTSANSA